MKAENVGVTASPQTRLPPHDAEMEAAIGAYLDAYQKRAEANKAIEMAKAAIRSEMERKSLTVYYGRDAVVSLEDKLTVRVKP